MNPKISINRDKIPRLELKDELANSIEVNPGKQQQIWFRGKSK
jgi:hypothetical protein